MRGHIRRRTKGAWSVVVDAGRHPGTGRRQQRWFTVHGTKHEAEAKLADLVHELEHGVPPVSGRLLLRDYLETWLRDVVAVRHLQHPATLQSYQYLVRPHINRHIGSIPIQRLLPAHIERMEAALLKEGLSANSVRHVHVVLSKALKDAMPKGLINHNPCGFVTPPTVGRYRVNLPPMEQVMCILDAGDTTPYGVVYHFLLHTGCRRSEALALRWANVDLERGVVSIVATLQRIYGKGLVFGEPKSAAGRRGIALDAVTVRLLRQHRARQAEHRLKLGSLYEDNGLVFAGPYGKPLDPSVLTHSFGRIATKAGHPHVRLHDLRHAHISGLIAAGVHLKVVQERAGHTSAAFTADVYGHVAPGLQEQAAKAFADLMEKTAAGTTR